MDLNHQPESFSQKVRFLRLEGTLQAVATFCAATAVFLVLLLILRPDYLDFPKTWLAAALLTLVLLNVVANFMVHYYRSRWMQVERSTSMDGVSGVMNRATFETLLDEELRRGGRYHYPVTLCYLDLDDFKSFSEHFGRSRGDEMLHKFAQLLQGSVRFADCVARYHNDEFCVLLPHTDIVKAEKFIFRITAQCQERLDFTFCGGVTSYQAGENKSTFIMRAVTALGQAKREGKKKVRYVVGDNSATVSF